MADKRSEGARLTRADRLLVWLTMAALLVGGAGALAIVLWADALL